MNQGHLYLIAGLLSFSALGIFFKIADVKNCRPSAINALLYAWSVLIAITLTLVQTDSIRAPASILAIALPFGMAASVAILALQAGIRYGNISTSWLAINLSAFIPTLGSILLYHEPVRASKVVALLLIPVSMMLLWKDKRDAESQDMTNRHANTGLIANRKEAP
jgi:drug/metabolite transporter (DMT)-like permease